MDKLFRFSDYDLFGYLAAGIIVFGLCDFTIGTQIVWKDYWTISSAVAVILGGYVLGHIVSGLAALIVDRWLVRSLLGTPANLLLRANTRKITLFQRVMLGDFLKPLHPSLRSRVIERAGMSTHTAEQPEAGEELFWRVWPIIKREPIPYGRADSFLKLYGFCHTLSFISFGAALVFAAKAYTGWNSLQLSAQTYLMLAVAAAVVSFVMFRRYLRFFRAYSLEVFSTFAEPAND